jgi:hypothetical protein
MLVAAGFVIASCVPFYVYAATVDPIWPPSYTLLEQAAFLVVLGSLGLLTGFLVRWPALLLPALVYLALLPLGDDLSGDGSTYAGIYVVWGGIPSFVGLMVGSLAGRFASVVRSRERAEA